MKTALASERSARVKIEARYNCEVGKRAQAEALLEREMDRRRETEKDVAELRARVSELENARMNFDQATAALLDVIKQDPDAKAMLSELVRSGNPGPELSMHDSNGGEKNHPGQFVGSRHHRKRGR
jgi:chromosome segregation ATPase